MAGRAVKTDLKRLWAFDSLRSQVEEAERRLREYAMDWANAEAPVRVGDKVKYHVHGVESGIMVVDTVWLHFEGNELSWCASGRILESGAPTERVATEVWRIECDLDPTHH